MVLITCTWRSSIGRKEITLGWLAISIIVRNRLESHFQVRSVLPDPASVSTFHSSMYCLDYQLKKEC